MGWTGSCCGRRRLARCTILARAVPSPDPRSPQFARRVLLTHPRCPRHRRRASHVQAHDGPRRPPSPGCWSARCHHPILPSAVRPRHDLLDLPVVYQSSLSKLVLAHDRRAANGTPLAAPVFLRRGRVDAVGVSGLSASPPLGMPVVFLQLSYVSMTMFSLFASMFSLSRRSAFR